MSETVLVIAAHPDDEILGLGGTLARHSQAGDEVHCIIMAEGATSRQGDDGEDSNDELSALKAAARNAAADIGMKSPVFANFSDNRMDTSALLDVVQWLENKIKTIVPSIVYTHHSDDLNLDHQIVHKAVLTAFRSLSVKSSARTGLASLRCGSSFSSNSPLSTIASLSPLFAVRMTLVSCFSHDSRSASASSVFMVSMSANGSIRLAT